MWFGGLRSSCQTKNSRAATMSASFDVGFRTQSTCSAFIYFLKNFTVTNVVCWKSVFCNVCRLLLECCLNALCKRHLWFLYKANSKHKHETRFLRLEIMSKLQEWIKIMKVLFPGLELNFGTQFLTNFVNSPKERLKNIFMTYCSW